jgi:hypothetical protein
MATDKTHLNSLLDNAFDFLEASLDEFMAKPKFSVLHFCTAIELFMKARLVSEHWSLVVSKSGELSFKKYQAGDFHSVTLDEAVKRINEATSFPPVSDDALKEFRKISAHRNKVVHFVHLEAHAKDTKAIEMIATEQCRGWFRLRSLFEEWDDLYSAYGDKIKACEKKLAGHKVFLKEKFNQMAVQLAEEKADGVDFKKCPACGLAAFGRDEISSVVYRSRCRVCGHHSYPYLVLTCDACGEELECDQVDDDGVTCPCENVISREEVLEQLGASEEEDSGINCRFCEGYHTVVRLEEEDEDGFPIYLCLQCLEESSDVGQCEWCNEGQLGGVDEMSYYTGCSQCDGHAGWHKDD